MAGDGDSVGLLLGGRGGWTVRRISIVVDINNINLLCDSSGVIIFVVAVMVVVVMVMGEELVHSLGYALADRVVGAYRRHALAYACTRLADNRKKS